MSENLIEYSHGEYLISTDKTRLQIAVIHEYLSQRSYWAKGRTLETVQTSLEHSLCFGVYHFEKQAGFARVVTDYATFGWVCDVFILEAYRGKGLAKVLVQAIVNHPILSNIKRLLLSTKDAHELYRRYGGFGELSNPENWLELRKPNHP